MLVKYHEFPHPHLLEVELQHRPFCKKAPPAALTPDPPMDRSTSSSAGLMASRSQVVLARLIYRLLFEELFPFCFWGCVAGIDRFFQSYFLLPKVGLSLGYFAPLKLILYVGQLRPAFTVGLSTHTTPYWRGCWRLIARFSKLGWLRCWKVCSVILPISSPFCTLFPIYKFSVRFLRSRLLCEHHLGRAPQYPSLLLSIPDQQPSGHTMHQASVHTIDR